MGNLESEQSVGQMSGCYLSEKEERDAYLCRATQRVVGRDQQKGEHTPGILAESLGDRAQVTHPEPQAWLWHSPNSGSRRGGFGGTSGGLGEGGWEGSWGKVSGGSSGSGWGKGDGGDDSNSSSSLQGRLGTDQTLGNKGLAQHR